MNRDEIEPPASSPHTGGARRRAGRRHRVRPEPAVLYQRRYEALRRRSISRAAGACTLDDGRGAVSRRPAQSGCRSAFSRGRVRRHGRGHMVAVLDRQYDRRAQRNGSRAETRRRGDFHRTRALSRRRRQEVARSADAGLAPMRGRLSFESEDGRSFARRGVHDREPADRLSRRPTCAHVHVRRRARKT